MKFFIILAALIGLAVSQRENDPRCPRGPRDNRPDIFGHPWDCEVFFRCHEGTSLQFTCPSDRHWSVATNTCEPIHLAGCQQSNHPRPPVDGRNDPNSPHCPAFDAPGEVIYHPHISDCAQFFQCSAGRAVLLRCPSGFMWNIERTFCDRESNVRCTTPRRF